MSNIAKRLRASVGFDAVNGNSHDRAIVAKQMREAADYIDKLEKDAAKLAKVRALVDNAKGRGYGHPLLDDLAAILEGDSK